MGLAFAGLLAACGDAALPAGHLASSADRISAGLTDCGSSSTPFSVDISNDAPLSMVNWSAEVDGPFVLDGPASGTLSSFEKTTVVLHAAVPSSAAAGLPVTGSLRFRTNDPNEPVVTIPLTVTPRGATLIMPSSPVEFGDIPVLATSPSVGGSIRNVGNAPAEIVVGIPSDPQFAAQTKTLFLLPGAKDDVAMTFSPTKWTTSDASLPITVNGPVCGALAPMALRGRGTKGVVLTSPGSLDFGLVDCGDTAGPKKVTVENEGDAAFDVVAVLAKGTSFTVAPVKANVAPGASVEITVTPNAVPQVSAVTPDLYGDTLTLTTNAVSDPPHVLALHETAQGAIFSLTIPQGPIRSRVDDVKLVPVTLTNIGNASGAASVTSSNNALRISAAGALAGQTVTPNLEVRADPEKVGIDDLEALAWNTSAPTCGTNVTSGTVHAYDSAVDAAVYRFDQCVIGHTHRLYCWGVNDDGALPFPSALPVATPKLVQGETPDQVAPASAKFSLRTGSTIKTIKYWNSVLSSFPVQTLPQTFAQAVYSESSSNFHWCAISAQASISCVGYSYGAWANGGDCFQSSDTPVAAYPSVTPFRCTPPTTYGARCYATVKFGPAVQRSTRRPHAPWVHPLSSAESPMPCTSRRRSVTRAPCERPARSRAGTAS
ncbi:hypothetical protein BH09MYX1_BH09MYX1_28350 [soil metagenome]